MDTDIRSWISEFLMRNTAAQDHVIKKLLQALPVAAADSRFKKTVILRTIQSEISDASVTETTLDNLEVMEELDRDDEVAISEALKAAYCAVAVECTVKYLAGNGDRHWKYLEAVKRLWRGRIGGLERSGRSELLTWELRRWRDDVEAAVWDGNVAKRLLKVNTRNEALEAVRVFLGEAWALLGPTFLQSAEAVAEPDGVQSSGPSAGDLALKNVVNRVEEVAATNPPNVGELASPGKTVNRVEEVRSNNTPNARQDVGELADTRVTVDRVVKTSGNVVELDAETLNQVEKVAAKMPNVIELDAETLNRVEKVAANMTNVFESAAKMANPVPAAMWNVVDLDKETVNPVEELPGNTTNVSPDVGELPEETANQVGELLGEMASQVASNTWNVGQEVGVSRRPELCEGEERGLVASRSCSWELIVRDRAAAGRVDEIRKGLELSRRKHSVLHRRSKGGVKITNTEEMDINVSCSKYDSLSSSEVNKVQAALKSSSLELRAVVKDPLPDALRLSETVISDMVTKDEHHEPSVENQVGKDVDASNPPVNNIVEPAQTNDANRGNQSGSHQNNAPRPSLMERNDTACTYEWNDSIDDSHEGTTNHASRLHLPSPKRKLVSPLKKHEPTKFTRRRQIKKWSLLEEDTLRTSVQKYGKGNWKLILNSNRDIFEERTEVDLKDKWRNMSRY